MHITIGIMTPLATHSSGRPISYNDLLVTHSSEIPRDPLLCRDPWGSDSKVGTPLPGCDRPEPLLSRRVPDLKLDGLPVQLDGADLEVDADGGDVGLGVGVVGEAEEEAGLAHAGVADQEELEQIVTERERERERERKNT